VKGKKPGGDSRGVGHGNQFYPVKEERAIWSMAQRVAPANFMDFDGRQT